MKQFLLKFFTWWSGTTFGTNLWTSRFGELVGTDEQGNTYYRTKGGKIDPTLGFERRWVIYNGYAEATKIPPDWHGWIHHTVDVPPTEETYTPREWQKPHQPNLTGSPAAYRPSGSTSGQRPASQGDRRLPGLDAGLVTTHPFWTTGCACRSAARAASHCFQPPALAVRPASTSGVPPRMSPPCRAAPDCTRSTGLERIRYSRNM